MYPKLKHILMSQCLINRESQISFEKSNLGLYQPNNPLIQLFQEMKLRNPQAPYSWRYLEKFENPQKKKKKMQFYSLNWSKFRTISKDQFERAKTPLAFIFLA